jgi:hypothetical protein
LQQYRWYQQHTVLVHGHHLKDLRQIDVHTDQIYHICFELKFSVGVATPVDSFSHLRYVADFHNK